MTLNKKKTKLSPNYETKVTCKSELQNDAVISIGVIDDNEITHDMDRIMYNHNDGKIYDQCKEIKTINKKLEKDSIIKIRNELVKKTNKEEPIFQITVTINDAELFASFYQAKDQMTPHLRLTDEVELGVEISSKIL